MVAEKTMFGGFPGLVPIKYLISSMNPMSSMRSTSSKTTIGERFKIHPFVLLKIFQSSGRANNEVRAGTELHDLRPGRNAPTSMADSKPIPREKRRKSSFI